MRQSPKGLFLGQPRGATQCGKTSSMGPRGKPPTPQSGHLLLVVENSWEIKDGELTKPRHIVHRAEPIRLCATFAIRTHFSMEMDISSCAQNGDLTVHGHRPV